MLGVPASLQVGTWDSIPWHALSPNSAPATPNLRPPREPAPEAGDRVPAGPWSNPEVTGTQRRHRRKERLRDCGWGETEKASWAETGEGRPEMEKPNQRERVDQSDGEMAIWKPRSRGLWRETDGQKEKEKQGRGMKKQMQRGCGGRTDGGMKDRLNSTPHSLNFLLAFLVPSVILASRAKPLAGRQVAPGSSGHQC